MIGRNIGYGYPDLALTDCSGQGDGHLCLFYTHNNWDSIMTTRIVSKLKFIDLLVMGGIWFGHKL